jgi:hypothetical protein
MIVLHWDAIELNAITQLLFVGKRLIRTKKRQVCIRIEESIIEEMEQVREKTGVPISTQIELRLKGFTITSVAEKGSWNKVLQWYSNLEKDDELADNAEKAVARMKELKLH